ncbi:MAG: ATP-binding protein, partial [Anaerolineae bacterium]|nr:ATP-binding protein [Anaerolineae bacterium]
MGKHLHRFQDAWSPVQRGKVLRQLMIEILESLGTEGNEGQYARQVLKLSYVSGDNQYDILARLHIGRSTYYRHLADAISLFEHHFIGHAQPSVRLEYPPSVVCFVGRDRVVQSCLNDLYAGRSIALTGAAGVGKTLTASVLVREWTQNRAFWYSFVVGLNDRIENLLFALSHFFHSLGASNLLTQIVADRGATNTDLAISLLRADLHLLSGKVTSDGNSDCRPILFCFDEIDVLRSDENDAHMLIATLLKHLKAEAPLLIAGQIVARPYAIDVDREYRLTGLPLDDLIYMADALGTPVSAEQAIRWN